MLTFDILATILAVIMAASAVYDFTSPAALVADLTRGGYSAGFERTLGIIKVIGAVGLFTVWSTRWLAVVAAFGFVLYFILAIRTHLSAKDAPAATVPAVGIFILTVATTVAGLVA